MYSYVCIIKYIYGVHVRMNDKFTFHPNVFVMHAQHKHGGAHTYTRVYVDGLAAYIYNSTLIKLNENISAESLVWKIAKGIMMKISLQYRD